MRIVADTNLLVSGVISKQGLPRRLVDGALAGAFELCPSEVLSREKFAARLVQARMRARRALSMTCARSP